MRPFASPMVYRRRKPFLILDIHSLVLAFGKLEGEWGDRKNAHDRAYRNQDINFFGVHLRSPFGWTPPCTLFYC